MKSCIKQSLEWLILPLVILATFLSALILFVSIPSIWEALYDSVMQQKLPAKMLADAHSISRAFWNGETYTEVNASLNNPVLGLREINHFADVRNIIHSFLWPLGIGTVVLLICKIGLKLKLRWAMGLVYFLAIGGALTIWALMDWRDMFQTLHWWIFQNDSWKLPKRSYSLYLYPYAVWQVVSAVVMTSLFVILTSLSLVSLKSHLKRKMSQKK